MAAFISGLLGAIANASVFIGAPMGIGYLSAHPIPDCYYEPVRTVAWKDNPNGYSFEVAGCEYQANKDKYVLK